jgi:hypothetical protein
MAELERPRIRSEKVEFKKYIYYFLYNQLYFIEKSKRK